MSSSPFVARGVKPIAKEYDQEYIHYYEKEVLSDISTIDPAHPDRFLVVKETTEYERIPIREYINQFASKVGLRNELKGVISKAQMDDFISEHMAKPGFVDLTKLPDTAFEMEQLVARVDEAWSSIPEELKAGISKEEFLKTLTTDKVKDYLKSKVSTKVDTQKEGE